MKNLIEVRQIMVFESNDNYDKLDLLIKESELLCEREYYATLSDIFSLELTRINESNISYLNESFNFKSVIDSIMNGISVAFEKIKEVIMTAAANINIFFKRSDQLFNATKALFLTKFDKYADKIRYKVSLPTEDFCLGENGYDISKKFINKTSEMINKLKQSINKNESLSDNEFDTSNLISEVLNNKDVNINNLKSYIKSTLFEEEREYVGVSDDLKYEIMDMMKLSPTLLTRSWSRDAENEMKELKKEVIKLEKDYKNSEDNNTLNLIYKCKAYIVACTSIVAKIHNAYIEANFKALHAYRKVYMKVINTIKTPKEVN